MAIKLEEGIQSLKEGIAVTLREIRKEAGMSQLTLAKKIGVDQSLISRIENASNDGLDLVCVYKIAHVLNMDIEINFLENEVEVEEEKTEKVS